MILLRHRKKWWQVLGKGHRLQLVSKSLANGFITVQKSLLILNGYVSSSSSKMCPAKPKTQGRLMAHLE
jgi:hypothetical protein